MSGRLSKIRSVHTNGVKWIHVFAGHCTLLYIFVFFLALPIFTLCMLRIETRSYFCLSSSILFFLCNRFLYKMHPWSNILTSASQNQTNYSFGKSVFNWWKLQVEVILLCKVFSWITDSRSLNILVIFL